MIVDGHGHFVPRSLIGALESGELGVPSVRAVDAGGGSFAFDFGQKEPRGGPPTLFDADGICAWLDSQGMDHQVVATWSEIFGYGLPLEEGARWARAINEHTWDALTQEGRLTPIATLPMQDGEAAARELEHAHALGYRAATIGTTLPGGRELDADDLNPLWESAARLGMPIFVHPVYPRDVPRLERYKLQNIIGRANETTLAIAHLLFGGVLDRHPALDVVVAHGGGTVPYMLGRFERQREIVGDLVSPPLPGFSRLYFDTVVYRGEALRYLIEVAGASKILLGSDYPFPVYDPFPWRPLDDAGLSPAERAAISGENAVKLFQLREGANDGAS